ncbi:MAG: hypothetical protein L6R41_008001 [Letrouitia leprolyta]|nr:MAG: hypothetical protein L6R41_008001 [Letrouitia leprolyta]
MKEESLEDFNAPMTDFAHTNILPPEAPIRITLHSVPDAPREKLKRSTVMWTLKALAVECMRTRDLFPMLFSIHHYLQTVYSGVLASPINDGGTQQQSPASNAAAAALQSPPTSSSLSSTITPRPSPLATNNETISISIPQPSDTITTPDNNPNHPTYDLTFTFLGSPLPATQIFTSILTTILDLAPLSASTTLSGWTNLSTRSYTVWIFIVGMHPPMPEYVFQQYHCVALLEAVARYYVLKDTWMELVFEMRLAGYRMAWGCVTRGVAGRRWCGGMMGEEGRDGGMAVT